MDVNLISVSYVGDQRALVRSGGRTFIVDERTKVGQEDAKFCPVELVATSLGA